MAKNCIAPYSNWPPCAFHSGEIGLATHILQYAPHALENFPLLEQKGALHRLNTWIVEIMTSRTDHNL